MMIDRETPCFWTYQDQAQYDINLGPSPRLEHYPQEKLPLYLGFFEFVHNVRKRGKALLGALIELLVS